jgi:hypothetical protein
MITQRTKRDGLVVNKLSVGNLSAISANLGTVNAGTLNAVDINSAVFNGGNISGVNISGSSIFAGPGGNVVIDGGGISMPDGTSVSGYRLSLGGAQIWGVNSGGIYTSAGLFAYGQIGTDSNVFAQGDIMANGYRFNNGADSQNAGIGRPLVVAGDGIVHGVGNGVNGTYNGFTFENGICTGHP